MPAKRLLRDKDKKFRLLFEEHPQPMWIFDAESQKILEANPAAAALYGYSRDEFRAMTLADIQGPARPAASAWRHRTASGRMIDVELAVHEIQYGGRKAELVVLMDITDRRHLEDQLRQAEQIMMAGERAAALTKQLLAFSRRRLQQPKVLDLNVQAASLGTMLQRLIGE